MDYNPHDIYFIWDHCIDYIDNDEWFEKMKPAIFQVKKHPNGIDIYLFDDDATGPAGAMGGVGVGSAFSLGGMDVTLPIVPRVKSHLMSHEMGHVLSLFHTFEGCGMPGAERVARSGPEANCGSAGDLLCDTDADPRAYNFTNGLTCVWSQQENCGPTSDPISSYTPDLSNIMASTHPLNCTNHFSNGQIQNMKMAIETLPQLQATVMDPNNLTTHIYQNTTYDQDDNMLGDIFVHSGAELLIEAKIGMPQNARILVERNARLKVSGGILTRRCDAEDWSGIQVLGNNLKDQPNAMLH